MVSAENVQRLLYPLSLVFVGGRDLAGAIRNCEELGYDGEIYVVHPKYEELAGRKCYPSVSELPQTPDAAFVGIRRDRTIDAVRELSSIGVGGCVCHAAGFAELDAEGEELQKQLVEAAGEMALAGPNCYGLLNYLEGAALWPDLHGGQRAERGIAVVSQSGNVSLNLTMTERSLPVSHVVSIGNQAALGFGDYVDALSDDPRVDAIGLYIEGIGDVPGFCRAALRALRRGVPVVALKSGASQKGARATLSHTSSLSGPDDLYDALFEKLGIVRASTLTAFVETLKLLSTAGPLEGRSLGVIAGSGGDAAMLADLASPAGFSLPDLDDDHRQRLREQLGDFVSVSNPLDYNTAVWGDREALERCFATVMEGGFDAAVLTLDYPRPGCGDHAAWDAAAEALVSASASSGVPAVVASTLPELMPGHARERLLSGGVTPLQGLPEAVSALSGAAWYGERRAEILASEPGIPSPAQLTNPEREPLLLDESESKRRLADYGLRLPESRLAAKARAPSAASELGFPVALKAADESLAHKSESGAVALDLRSEDEVERAVQRIRPEDNGSLEKRFLVERMVGGAVAELIVGVRRDERFGLALVIGSGGTLAELVRDCETLLLPVSRKEVSQALYRLSVSRLLDGFRGGPAGDREAVIEAVLSVAEFVEDHRERLLELDVNPLLILPEEAVAVDALIRLQPE